MKTEYLKPQIPEIPQEPSYYPVVWQRVNSLYCLDFENAKNHLKNQELKDSHIDDLTFIIEGLKND